MSSYYLKDLNNNDKNINVEEFNEQTSQPTQQEFQNSNENEIKLEIEVKEIKKSYLENNAELLINDNLDHTKQSTHALFQDCKNEIDRLEQVANLDQLTTSDPLTIELSETDPQYTTTHHLTNPSNLAAILNTSPSTTDNMNNNSIEIDGPTVVAQQPQPTSSDPPKTPTKILKTTSRAVTSFFKKNSPNNSENTTMKNMNRQISFASTVDTESNSVQAINNNNINNTVDNIKANSQIPVYYELRIKLKEGKNLAIRDFGGKTEAF